MEITKKGSELVILFHGVVGEDITVEDIQNITKQIEESASVKLLINSPGGYVTDGWAMYNILSSYKQKIDVEVIGLAASMGSIIALCGKTLTMRQGTYFMIHNPWSVAMGDSNDFRHEAEILDKMALDIIDLYMSKTALTNDEVKEMMDKETWLSADESKEYGFADFITEDKMQAVACVNKMKFKNMPKMEVIVEKEITKKTKEVSLEEKISEVKNMEMNRDELKNEIVAEVLAKIPAGRELDVEKAEVKNDKWFNEYLISKGKNEPAKNVTVKTADGYGVPTLIDTEVIKKRNSLSFMRESIEGVEDARIRKYSADTKVTFKSTPACEIIAEGADYPNNTDAGDPVVFDSYKMGSTYSVTEEVAEDTVLNVTADFTDDAGKAVAIQENKLFAVGTGTDEPQGFVVGGTVAVTTASATAITYDELVDLDESLSPLYSKGSAYFMGSSTKAYIRKLKDGQNRPILQEYNNGLATLFGKQIIIVEDMDAIAATKKVIVVGNRAGYGIADRTSGLKTRVSENTKNGDTEVRWSLRTDGKVIDPNAFKVLQMKAV